jgi:hypothetical protein
MPVIRSVRPVQHARSLPCSPLPSLELSFGPLSSQNPRFQRFTTKGAARMFNLRRIRELLVDLIPCPKNAHCPKGHRLKNPKLCYGAQAGLPQYKIGHWYQWVSVLSFIHFSLTLIDQNGTGSVSVVSGNSRSHRFSVKKPFKASLLRRF